MIKQNHAIHDTLGVRQKAISYKKYKNDFKKKKVRKFLNNCSKHARKRGGFTLTISFVLNNLIVANS